MIAARTLRPVLRIRPTSLACGVIAAVALLAAPLRAGAADVIKSDNANALNLGTSWTSGTAPTSSDVAVWDSTYNQPSAVSLGATASWGGIRIANTASAVNIGNSTSGWALTLGSSGIDMSVGTTQASLFLSGVVFNLNVNANQDWNVASGRTLQLFSNNNSNNSRLNGSGNITIKGGGTVSMLVGTPSSSTFSATNGNSTYTGNFTVSEGSKLISQRQGTQAFGTGAITLDNGIISQQNGSWSYSTNIILGSGSGTITNDSATTSGGRYLNLTGTISGGGGLIIANNNGAWGEGVILTGSNTFTGPITINSNGVLRIGGEATTTMNSVAPGTLGSIPSSVAITNSGVLGFGWNNAQMFGNNISGSGVVRLGRSGGTLPTGVVTLSGTNTYSGGTQVNSGSIIFSSTAARPGAGTVTVAAGATIGLGVGSTAAYFGSSDLDGLFANTLSGFSLAATSNVAIDTTASDFTYSSNIGSVSRTLTKYGGNTLTLSGNNAYTGITTVVGGTLSVSADSNLGAAPGAATIGSLTIREGAALRVTTGFTLSTNRSIAVGPTTGTGTGTIVVDSGQTLTFGGTMANNGGTGAFVKDGPGTLTLTSTGNSYTGNTVIAGGTLKISGGKLYNAGYNNTAVVTVNTGDTLELDSFGYDTLGGLGQLADYSARRVLNGGSINVVGNSHSTGNTFRVAVGSSGTLSMATAGQTLSLTGATADDIQLGGALTVAGDGNLTISEVIINLTGGTGSIVKAGAGTLTLGGVNTYTGATTINAGTVAIAADTGLGTAPGSNTAGSLVINGGALAITTGFTLSANRGIAVGPPSGSGIGTLDVASGQTLTYGGTIANNGGTGGLTKIGAGVLALAGASTYTGPTAIDGGVLQIGAGSTTGAISSSSAVSVGASGTLTFNRSNALTFANPISGAGTILKLGSVETGLTGSNSFSGFIDVQAGKLAFENANAAAGTPSVNVASGAILSLGTTLINGTATIANLTGSGTIDPMYGNAGGRTLSVNPTTTGTFSGIIRDAISGAVRTLAFVKAGPNTLTLTGTSTYTGATTINGGTLRIEGAGVVSGSSALAIADVAGATFDLNGTSQTVGGLSGGGATGGAVELGGGTLTVNKASGSDTFSGVVNGSGGLTKTGAGALVLNGVNGYSGPTTITGGTLQIGGAGQMNAGAYAAAIANDGAFVFASSANQTLSGVVSGIGSLTHSGVGAVTLTGSNTYTGNTTISSGTLEVGGAGRLGGGAYAGAIANDGSLRLTTSANQSLSGGITGNGSLLKAGSGRLTLTGANTFSGATTVDAGRLVVNGTVSTSAITVNAGATLGGSGAVANVTLAGGGIVSPGNSPGLLSVANMTWSGTSAYDWEMYDYQSTEGVGWDSIAGSGSLTVNATSASPFTFNLLSLSGTSTLGPAFNWSQTTSGSFRVASFTGGITLVEPSGTWWSMNTAGFTPFDPATGAFSLSTTSNDIYLVYTYTPPPSFVWTVGSGSWSTAGNWDTSTAPSGTPELFFSGAGGTATNDITTGTGVGEIATVKGITFTGSASGGYTLDGNAFNLGTLGVTNNSTFQQTIQNGMTLSVDSTLNAVTAGLVVSGTIDTNGDILTVTGSSTTTLSSVVTGSGGLVKFSTGTLALQGANDYTGGTTINAGTVVVGNGSNAGVLPGNVTNNATLVFDRSDDVTYAGVISGTGGVTKVNAATLTLTGNNTFTGLLTITGGTVQVGGGGTSGSLAGNVTNNSALVFNRSDSLTVANDITGNGTLTQAGAGTLILAGANSYSGATTISSGTLQVGSGGTAGTLGDGPVTNDGVLVFSRSDSATVANDISGAGTLTQAGTGVVILTGANTYSGATTIGSGTLQVGSGGAVGSLGSGAVTNNATLAFNRSNSVTVANDITGNGAVAQAGTGTVILTGENTYAGATLVSSGTLQVGSGGTAGTLGSGAVTNNAALVFDRSDSLTVANVISGSGTLAQVGSGTLVLSSANTFSGGSLVSSGALLLGNAAAVGSGTVTLNGGTLSSDSSTARTLANALAIGGNVTLGDAVNNGLLTFSGSVGLGGVTRQITTASDVTLSGAVANGGLTKAGAATLTLSSSNAFSGGISLNAGTLQAGNANSLGSGTLTINSGTLTSGATQLTLPNNIVLATNATFAGTAGTQGMRLNGIISGNGSIIKEGTGRVTLAGANTFTGSTTINAGILAVNLDALATSTSTYIAGTTDGGLAIAANGTTTINNLTGSADGRIRSDFNLVSDGARTLAVNQSSDGTFAGTFIQGGATRPISLVKSGAAVLTLTNAANAYTGTTSITAGTLRIGGAGRLNSGNYAGAIAIAESAVLQFDSTAAQTLSGVISGSGTLQKSNTGLLTVSNNLNSFTGDIQVDSGTMTLSASTTAYAGAIDITGGRMILTDNNTLSGTITIGSGGTLQVGNGGTAGAIGNAATVVNDGAIEWNRSNATNVGAAISGSGSLTKFGNGALNLNANNTYAGITTISSGTISLGNGGTAGSIGGGGVVNNATFAFNRSDALTVSSAISGSGAVVQQGAGITTLTGTNSYTGSTTISSGTLALSGGGSIQSSSGVNLSASGAAFDISGASGNRTIGTLAGAAGSQILLGGNGLTAGDATNTSFGGGLSGSGDFTKAGSGILTISAAQSLFTGGVNVSAGTLKVDGASFLLNAQQIFVAAGATLDGSGAGFTVFNGQTLGGYGTINAGTNGLAFNSGAFLSPGGSVGQLDGVGNATFSGGMTYVFEVNDANGTPGISPGWDLFTTDGALTLAASGSNQINLDIVSLAVAASGSAANFDPNFNYAWKFVVAGSPISSFNAGWFNVDATGFQNATSGGQFYVARGDQLGSIGGSGTDEELYVVFAAVPEPGTVVLAGIGLAVAGLAAVRRRRRCRNEVPTDSAGR